MTTKVSSQMLEDGSEVIGLVPVGAMLPFGGTTEPANWLFARGQAVSRTTYATLFAAIGTAFGAGDGSTTFNVPDLRGRVPVGRDNMGGTPANRLTQAVSGVDATTVGAAGGDQRLHQHNHGVTDPGHAHTGGAAGDVVVNHGINEIASSTSSSTGSATTGITIQNAGGGASQNVQPVVVSNWIIRAK